MGDKVLDEIWKRQRQFAENFYSLDKLSFADREKWTKEYVLQMADECFELLREINWKHHKLTKKEVNYDKIREELIDVFKFWLNVCNLWGVTPEDFVKAFHEKSTIVEDKFEREKQQQR